MSEKIPVIPLDIDGRRYRLKPDMRLIAEIEDELGALPVLSAKFATGLWRVTELVTLVQILLQSQGRTADFFTLGNIMLADGFAAYVAAVRAFLSAIIDTLGEKP